MPFRFNLNRTPPVHQPAHQADAPSQPLSSVAPSRRESAQPSRRPTSSWQTVVRSRIMEQPSNDLGHRDLQEMIELVDTHRPGPYRPARSGWFHLDLSGRGIVIAPTRFPSGLFSLDLSDNRLNFLPNHLPSDLEVLQVRRNQLIDLPARLPSRLRTLDLSRNHLVDLSPAAIHGLLQMPSASTVDLTFNPLSPETIERLEQLQNTPGYRGPRILLGPIGLDLGSHHLVSVPHDLPSNLQELDLSFNALTAPIHHLPTELRTLNLSSTGLSRLPDDLPPSLQSLDATHNRLIDISEATIHRLITMGSSATVDLRYNPLSSQTINRLVQLQSSTMFRGPRIRFLPRSDLPTSSEMPNTQAQTPARAHDYPTHADIENQYNVNPVWSQADAGIRHRFLQIRHTVEQARHTIRFDAELIRMVLDQLQLDPGSAVERPAPPVSLTDAVSAWRPESPSRLAPTPSQWQHFSSEPNAAAFSIFLTRLGTTLHANNPAFRNSVSEWLHHLQTNAQLRGDTFTLSDGANASCNDRIYHAFNDMRQLRLASDVANGDYDQRLPELLTLARSMFRLGQLETIARKHAACIPGVDELEVYLGFQVMLRERLALPLATTHMHYPSMASIRPEHLELAYTRVIAAEREGFADFLANDWRPWQAVLQRQWPVQYEQAQEQLIDAMGEEFSTRLQARLQEIGLDNDPDAQRTLGPLVQAEIAREINGPLTQDFLRSNGLLADLG